MNRLKSKLKALSPGGSIGVLAPGSPASPEYVRLGTEELEKRGFKVVSPLNPSERYGQETKAFTSASAEARATALMSLIEDPEIEAILAVRGGYGSAEMLPLLNFDKIAAAAKPLVGYSDVTALLVAIFSRANIPSIHGPTLATEFACSHDQDSAIGCDSLIEMLSNSASLPSYPVNNLSPGEAEGRLVVGNLSMLQTLIGTEWDVDFANSILVLEDVGEAPYRIHRMLNHLNLAGKFKNLRAAVFGRFSKCDLEHGPLVEDVIKDIFSPLNIPVATEISVGHNGLNLALPLGCMAKLTQGNLSLLESPLMENSP